MTTAAVPVPREWRGRLAAVLRAPGAPWSWRCSAQVLTGLALALVTSTVVLTLAAAVAGLAVTAVLAVPVLAALVACGRTFTRWQRSRLAAFTGRSLPSPPPRYPGDTWLRRLWAESRASRTWRQLGYHALTMVTGTVAGAAVVGCWSLAVVLTTLAGYRAALPERVAFGLELRRPAMLLGLTALGLLFLLVAPWVARLAARLDLALAEVMLAPSRSERLTRRVDSLARSRAEVIAAADSERRRIERDLHDGTQQRLVSLAMRLGIARASLVGVPPPVRETIESAHDEAKLALTELRDVVRGLHPAVLDDLGLDAALSGVAARSAVPVRLTVSLPRRPPAAVEHVAYFVVSEALSNIGKHAYATEVQVRVELTGEGLLRVAITDNGRGGADPDRGTGLRGLTQRVRSVDGWMTIESPAGGPTAVVAELPCPPGAGGDDPPGVVPRAEGDGRAAAGGADAG